MYHTFMYPYLSYCNIVWGRAGATIINRLLLLQIKGGSTHFLCTYDPHTDDLFRELGIFTIYKIKMYLTCQFMYKFKLKHLPSIFVTMFTYNRKIHIHVTRQSELLHLSLLRTTAAERTIRYIGVLAWNSIAMIWIAFWIRVVRFPSDWLWSSPAI